MNDTPTSRRIHILRDSVAKRIAAGEVIDRPYSVVRELLDNAIDAGAQNIDLYLERGGLDRVRVVDDGTGMSREDLELCWQPHTTSKIETAEDIYALSTLGFRGEALSSIASCARLSITSAAGEETPHTLEVHGGKKLRLEAGAGSRGTAVDVADLFFNMPGRRRFLKSAGAESSACKRTFLEKALPFPGIGFRLFIDGELRLFLPPGSRRERIARAHPEALPGDFLYEKEAEAGRFRLQTVLSSPSLVRRDRRYIHIYINRRRVSEYSLVQAVQYAYGSYLPGGRFPAAFIFAEVDPELVDFNIHPAKREARIKNLPDIHHQLVHLIGSFLAEQFPHVPAGGSAAGSAIAQSSDDTSPGAAGTGTAGSRGQQEELHWQAEEQRTPGGGSGAGEAGAGTDRRTPGGGSGAGAGTGEGERKGGSAAEPAGRYPAARRTVDLDSWKRISGTGDSAAAAERQSTQPEQQEHSGDAEPKVLGQLFGLFIAVEAGEELFLIDQHAAHERIIYERISAPGQHRQQLLVPLGFDTEEDETELLERRLEELGNLGIGLRRAGEHSWELTELPERWSGMEHELINFLKSATVPAETLRSELYADLACKAAVKDGERLDSVSAAELARQALELPVPRCPHGRPVWRRISREELLQSVGRI
jgi:DNA mismatch repair protein MutL